MAQRDIVSAYFALILWALALITDLLDGPIARRRGTVTAWSGTFDHATIFYSSPGIVCGSHARRVPVDPACAHHGGLPSIFDRFLLDSPAREAAREQTRPLQRHSLFRSAGPGHSDPKGLAVAYAAAHNPVLGSCGDDARIDGSAAEVPKRRCVAQAQPQHAECAKSKVRSQPKHSLTRPWLQFDPAKHERKKHQRKSNRDQSGCANSPCLKSLPPRNVSA